MIEFKNSNCDRICKLLNNAKRDLIEQGKLVLKNNDVFGYSFIL